MVKNRGFYFLVIVFLLGILLFLPLLSAFEFNGTVYDINGNRIANATVNITVRSTTDWSIAGYNATTSNESGWFNITVPNNAQWMYQPKISHINISIPTKNYTDYIGQTLPAFPSFMFDVLGSPNFYLGDAGTFNLTAINSSGGRIAFNYQIKVSAIK